VAAVFGLVVIALWLWMARATGQGRNWARILSTVLFGLATLQLRGVFAAPVSHLGVGLIVLGPIRRTGKNPRPAYAGPSYEISTGR
jgi:hypothetical protein